MSTGAAGDGLLISVCIPTHHGRRDDLAATLDRLLGQIADLGAAHAVELCVSDNASADGTEALVTALVAGGAPVRYQRNPRDLGGAANVMASVAMARGEWVWLHASDDLVAPGALVTVLATIAAHPEAVGITVGRATFDLTLTTEGPVESPALRPADPERARTFTRPEDAVAELGLLHTYLPSQVLRRAAWTAVLTPAPDRPTAVSRYYPHVYVIVRVLLGDRRPWVWVPDKLLLVRPRHDVALLGGTPLAAALGQPADLVRTWTAALGADGPRPARHRPLVGRRGRLHRALLARAASVWAVPGQLAAWRARPEHTRRDDLRMVAALTAVFWSLPSYWRTALPVLLRPARGPRRQTAPAARNAPDLALEVRASLPTQATLGRDLTLECEVENRSPHRARADGTPALNIGVRWHAGDDVEPLRQVDRVPLPHDLAPGACCRVTVRTPTPWAAGAYRLDVGAVIEGVAWCADRDPALGARVSIAIRPRTDPEAPWSTRRRG